MKKILLIDENKLYSEQFKEYFNFKDIEVINKVNIISGIGETIYNKFDLIIIDDSSPNISCENIVLLIREIAPNNKIIVLSNCITKENEMLYLNLGVTDFLTKDLPIDIIEKRLNYLADLLVFPQHDTIIHSKKENLIIVVESRLVKIDNDIVDLTCTELDILVNFIYRKNKIITREEFIGIIYSHSKKNDLKDSRIVDTHIKNIRKKTKIRSIKSIRGVGYQWVEV